MGKHPLKTIRLGRLKIIVWSRKATGNKCCDRWQTETTNSYRIGTLGFIWRRKGG